MILSRVFAVLACALLVAAFALASLLPPDLPLGQAALRLDPHSLSNPCAKASRCGTGSARRLRRSTA